MADVLATALEEIRGCERAATRGPWRVTPGGPAVETAWELPEGYARAGSAVPVASMVLTVGKAEREAANARFTAGARSDVPRLLAAVEAVLGVHALTGFHRHTEACSAHYASAWRQECPDCKVIEWTGCDTCKDEFGNPARPEDCKTRQAIIRALLGEESPGGA